MRQQNPISETLSRKLETPDFQLSWSHYQMLLRIENKEERSFYEIETMQNNWSLFFKNILRGGDF